MLFTDGALQQQKILIENGGCLMPGGKVVTSVPMMALDNSSTESMKAQSKLKRNTTSTTTSGHGTISEGECSSIINQPSPAPISMMLLNPKRSVRQQNSSPSVSTTPGSGIDPGTVSSIQRQQHQQPTTSSGYEST